MAYWVSRLCEEFGCLPTQALNEWLRVPAGFLEEVLETRAYVHAFSYVQAKDRPKDEKPSEPAMVRIVREIELEIASEDTSG